MVILGFVHQYFEIMDKITRKADDNYNCCHFFKKNNKSGMIFHENRLQADDSYEISFLISFKN